MPDKVADTASKHIIFAFVDPRTKRVFHVGCYADGLGLSVRPQQVKPPKAVEERCAALNYSHQIVVLQTVDSAPLFAWVKWSKRFRRDLLTTDWQQYSAQADALTNSNRVQRAQGLDIPSDATLHERFHEFDRRNPELFTKMLHTAQNMKAEGRRIFGVSAIIEEMRYSRAGTNRTDQFKINASNAAFYARKLQMADPSLCGLFAMRLSTADDLVLDNGRTWQDFAKEHAGELRFVETPDADEDQEWSY
ncbi:MAG: hypothetical protein WCC22_07565 [Terriglobales bacterium]